MQLDELGGPFDSPGRTESRLRQKPAIATPTPAMAGSRRRVPERDIPANAQTIFMGGGGRAGDYYEKRTTHRRRSGPGSDCPTGSSHEQKELLSSPGHGDLCKLGR